MVGVVSTTMEGQPLLILALHILGTAYSKQLKLSDQLTTRIKAAAAKQKLHVPRTEQVRTIIAQVGWNTGEVSPVVDELLGMVLTPTGVGVYNVELSETEILSIKELRRAHGLIDVAGDLLDQARLVYRN